MLKPLLLPQLVEERRKRESLRDIITDNEFESALSGYCTQTSSASEPPSPVSPTFSMRGHLRYSSSTSSLDAALQTPIIESPASPAFVAVKSSKRSLPDVQEEPQEREERDEDLDMMNEDDELYDCFCDDRPCIHRNSNLVQSSLQLSMAPAFDYDLNEGFFSDGEVEISHRLKKRREGESPISAMATRIGSRFPSFSRKWRSRKDKSSILTAHDTKRDGQTSRVASSRSSSISTPDRQGMEPAHDPTLPPTPTRSIFEEVLPASPIDIELANQDPFDREEHLASTPLLPPLMMDAAANNKLAVQSPLQSPSVAESNDPFSQSSTSIDTFTTPQIPGVPSPPLSTKPSVSSFHHVNPATARLIPTADIPPMLIADENDEWAIKLGHANFTVLPEPYLPRAFDIEACRQLRADWDLARTNYTKHLVRTGEHYGVTSNTYSLTEEKWAQTDAVWKRNNEATIQSTVDNDGDAFLTLRHTTFGGDSSHVMTRIPSLNDPKGQGKFPQLGDQEIVGPMAVVGQLHRTPSKKAKLMRFFVEKFPVGFGRP